jgi:hypothetical protein
VPARGIASLSPPDAAVDLGWNTSPAAKAMPSADKPETVPRIIPLSSRDNFMPLCHLPMIISPPE